MAAGNEVSVSVGAGNTITVAVAGSTGTTPTITNGGTANVTVTSVGDRGPQGDVGPATTLSIGTVAGGATAAATLTGPAGAQVLSLTLPKGDKGDTGNTGATGSTGATGPAGPANSLAIGTVTTGAAGSSASATVTGTAPNQTLSLTIPRGDTGQNIELQSTSTHLQWRVVGGSTWTNLVALTAITGPQGSTGAAGSNGTNGSSVELQTTSTHIQWRLVGGSTWTNLVALSAITGPQGPQGPATVAIGTVTTGAAGSSASVTNSGTSSNVVLDFTIPRGDGGTAGVSWQPVPMSPSASGTNGDIAYDASFLYVKSASGWRRTAIASWTPLGAPTSVSASAGNAQATVSWTAPVDNGGYAITDYAVQFSSNSGATWTTFSDGTSTATTATVTGLTNGTAYVFRVAAINAAGTGPYSSATSSVTPGGFSPTSIAGLTGWWDASDASTLYDSAIGGLNVSADGLVARWEDKSGSGRHFAQETSASSPVYKSNIKNSLSVMRFDGINDRMESSWSFQDALSVSGSTFFVVANAASVATNNSANDSNALIFGSGGGHGFVELRSNNTAASFGYDQSNSFKRATISYTPGSWKVFGVMHTGSSLLFRLNSDSPSSVAMGTRAFADSLVDLGTNYERTRFFDGDIGEIIAYNVPLSASDRQSIESYLMAKWGIT